MVGNDHSFDDISYEPRGFPVPASDEFSGLNGRMAAAKASVLQSNEIMYQEGRRGVALTEPAA